MTDTKKPEEIKEETVIVEVKEEKKEAKKASGNVAKLVDEIAKLSVLEVSELVTALQEKLGVSAAPAPMAPVATQAGTDASAQGGESAGGATQTVLITSAGANKIGVIKALREINQNLTLMDAKNMTEQVPAEVLKDAKAEDAKVAVDKLKAAGATIEVK